MANSAFLSYNSKDRSFAQRVGSDLKSRGLTIWMDEAEMRVGDSLIGCIEAAIDDVDYLVVILSSNSVSSEWVLTEVRMAMHREIAGKRVVVLPVLYKDCTLPGFLRDKVYVDMRADCDYRKGIAALTNRIGGDALAELKANEEFRVFEEFPFTKLWRTALATNVFTPQFSRRIRAVLAEMSSEDGEWIPAVAVSYLLFIAEAVQSASIGLELYRVLCDIVEDSRIRVFLRYSTLHSMLPAIDELIRTANVKPPAILEPSSQDSSDSLISQCVASFFDPAEYSSMVTDSGAAVDILARLWSLGDIQYRTALVSVLESYARQFMADPGEVLSPVYESLGVEDLDQLKPMLSGIREAWLASEVSLGLVSMKNQGEVILRRLTRDKMSFDDIPGVIAFYRHASQLEQSNDFSLYPQAMGTLNVETVKTIRRMQGDEFTYKLLSSLVSDSHVEPLLSVIALCTVVNEFGEVTLEIDDSLLNGVLEPKDRGQFRGSVVEGLCESLVGEDVDDYFAVNLLLSVAAACEEEQHKILLQSIRKYSASSACLKAIEGYIAGSITFEDLSLKLGKIGKSP